MFTNVFVRKHVRDCGATSVVGRGPCIPAFDKLTIAIEATGHRHSLQEQLISLDLETK